MTHYIQKTKFLLVENKFQPKTWELFILQTFQMRLLQDRRRFSYLLQGQCQVFPSWACLPTGSCSLHTCATSVISSPGPHQLQHKSLLIFTRGQFATGLVWLFGTLLLRNFVYGFVLWFLDCFFHIYRYTFCVHSLTVVLLPHLPKPQVQSVMPSLLSWSQFCCPIHDRSASVLHQ